MERTKPRPHLRHQGRTMNLIDMPWIPAATRDGRHDTYGIRQLFHEAGNIAWLDLTAEERLPLIRLLAAILIRAHADDPDPVEAWRRQWAANRLDMEPIDRYLNRWQDRFDPADPVHPFMQTSGLKVREHPAADLTLQYPPFTDHHGDRLDAGRAMLRLLSVNAYDGGGIKPADPHDLRAKAGKLLPASGLNMVGTLGRFHAVWPEYPTLARTLLANSPLRTVDGTPTTGADDLPAWERNPLTMETLGGTPDGICDELTMTSRRVLIDFDQDGTATGFRLTYGRITGRENLTKKEPHCIWDRTGATPAGVSERQPGLPLWWRLPAIQGVRRPLALDWARELAGSGPSMTLNWMACPYKQGTRPITISHEQATIRTGMIDNPMAGVLVSQTIRAVHAYTRLAGDITRKWTPDMADQLTEETASRLTLVMNQLLADMPTDPYETVHQVMREWGDELAKQQPMRSAQAYMLYLATLNRIGDDQQTTAGPEQTASTVKPVSPHGRTPKPIIRHGGGLADARFDTVKDAVEWLHNNSKPKAAAAGIYLALRKQSVAYGYKWKHAEGNMER